MKGVISLAPEGKRAGDGCEHGPVELRRPGERHCYNILEESHTQLLYIV